MSTIERAGLYQEQTGNLTSHDDIDRCLDALATGRSKLRQTPIAGLIELAEACIHGTMNECDEWVRLACEAKGLTPGTAQEAEDISNGVLGTVRYLRLISNALSDIEKYGAPRLPGEVVTGPNGRLKVQVMPTKGLYDSVAFSGFKAHIWMAEGVTRENLPEHIASFYRHGRQEEGIALVLGAGNVSSIPPTDAFTKIFQEGKVVLLKMNPVNEYLGPMFERAYAPLIEAGFLRIIYGGAEVGSYSTHHELVDEVHITGSVRSHDTIVWGPPGPERDRRKAENDPLLKKPITSELGNVSPWIVVPADYSKSQLRFQAENLAMSILNKCSFNCVATKVVVTHKSWPQRQQFLDYVQEVLDANPPRKAYYPGAEERCRRFSGEDPKGCPTGALPWTLKRDIDPGQDSLYFDEESFVCVCAETGLDAVDGKDFLKQAADFANNRLFGTLGATVVVHPSFRKDAQTGPAFDQFIAELHYGTIGINHWCALAYGMMTTPWGGYPGASIHDPVSGIGWIHNTYMLDDMEKAVMEGHLTVFPKPAWFPSCKNADSITRGAVRLSEKPSLTRLGGVILSVLKGL